MHIDAEPPRRRDAGSDAGTAPVRVLLADDSGFFRRRLADMLSGDPGIEIAGSVENGLEAVRAVARLRPDVVVMDLEMPVMNGVEAVRRIMQRTPTPVLIVSSLSEEGARITLDALEAGAVDYLPKSAMRDATGSRGGSGDLCARIHQLAHPDGHHRPRLPEHHVLHEHHTLYEHHVLHDAPPAHEPGQHVTPASGRVPTPDIVIVGTSTGGPVALQQILTTLPGDFPAPLLLIQHMPATFTPAFAQRLDRVCAIGVREAAAGDALKPGVALLAPGGMQLFLAGRGRAAHVRLREALPGENYRPSVDVAFTSVAEAFGGRALAIVLTGMGADGREGARRLKAAGATVWAQDRASSVVYGMPCAVAQAGLVDQVLPLAQIGMRLRQVA